VDRFKLAEEIHKSNPEHFYILSSIPLWYHLTGSGHKYFNTTPSIVLDPETGQVTRVHFNNSHRLPLSSSDIKSLLQQPRISNTEAVWCIKDFHGHHEKRISAVHVSARVRQPYDIRQPQADACQNSLHWPETDVWLLYQQGGLGQQTPSDEEEV